MPKSVQPAPLMSGIGPCARPKSPLYIGRLEGASLGHSAVGPLRTHSPYQHSRPLRQGGNVTKSTPCQEEMDLQRVKRPDPPHIHLQAANKPKEKESWLVSGLGRIAACSWGGRNIHLRSVAFALWVPATCNRPGARLLLSQSPSILC
jgi:hypothetical protein